MASIQVCECGDYETVDDVWHLEATDCCEVMRPACETGVVFDYNGDPDVRVCAMGKGCDAR